MNSKLVKRGLAAGCVLALTANLTACGYFLYPERKGQEGGRVDPVVVILDGAALLFGILPGVVAFAVDFTSGTIYLPAGGSSAIDRHLGAVDTNDSRQVIDQDGQLWEQVPLEVSADGDDKLQQLTATLATTVGTRVAPTDILWVKDLAALRSVEAGHTASL
ncbi:hypothetical protein [Microbulbifer discodermiae]|uniref:hypothetical protein n=1 Tax=Microbulbifer sp. 2201CG32-9 TaxID=3232309 RepID=UPI00345C31AB